VNITNADTIEFRIFRGTLKYNTLIATLQMVAVECESRGTDATGIAYHDGRRRTSSWGTRG